MKMLIASVVGIVLVGLCGVLIVSANRTRNCYIASQKELDAAAFQSNAYPDSKGTQCLITYETLTTLGACIDASHRRIPSSLASSFVSLSDQLVAWIRYGTRDVAALRVDHDLECADHADSMFVAPDLLRQ